MKKFLKSKFTQYILMIIRMLYFPFYLIVRRHFYFKIKTPLDTVEYLKKTGSSISRFGDGEFNIIFRNRSIGFQEYNEELKNDLLKVASDHKSLIAIPFGFKRTSPFNQKVKSFWWSYVVRNFNEISSLFGQNRTYLDSNFTRVITELKNHKEADSVVEKTKDLWKNRNVIIVEGAYTRFGVGNSLLDDCKTVSRILMPEKNAYSKKDEALVKINELGRRIDDPIVLLALGPTATVLSYILSENYQAIDIGHFDLQYEYKKYGNYKKTKISTRYDNERAGGNHVKNTNNKKYLSEIKYKIY